MSAGELAGQSGQAAVAGLADARQASPVPGAGVPGIAPSRRPRATVGARLRAAPHRFDPLQAMRLIELGRRRGGQDAAPEDEPFSVASAQTLAFVAAPLQSAEPDAAGRWRLGIGFLGLTGPLGVLPQFYGEAVIRASRMRNRAMAAFLDLFNRRLTGLFLRASEKYRRAPSLQHALSAAADGCQPADGQGRDAIADSMLALAGYGTPGLAGRTTVRQDALLYFAGLFAQANRSAASLETMLADYLGMQLRVEQFSGRWVPVAPHEQTRLSAQGDGGAFGRLGRDAMVGDRTWDAQGTFRIVVGPVRLPQMRALMPDGPMLRQLVDLVRAYVGPEFGFDVQIILARDDLPDLQLGPAAGAAAPRLGWNSWAKSLPALADSHDIILDPDLVLEPLLGHGGGP